MEGHKIKGESKALFLDNGAELTYCECGETNEENVICGAFFFHTFMPVLKLLAQHYHVYGIIMRFDGKGDERNADGSMNWSRQWGKDVYDFAQKQGIKTFHYVGKCHGSVPGWYLVKEHPEVLKSFASFFIAPHTCPQNSNKWFELMQGSDPTAMMRAALRRPEEGIKVKMEEMASVGQIDPKIIPEYAADFTKHIWASTEDCVETLKHTTVPVGYLFGTEDPFFEDHVDSNLFAIRTTRGARSVILGGERHLMEIDCPERVASEVVTFIRESTKAYR